MGKEEMLSPKKSNSVFLPKYSQFWNEAMAEMKEKCVFYHWPTLSTDALAIGQNL